MKLCEKLKKLEEYVVTSKKITPNKFLNIMIEISNINMEIQSIVYDDVKKMSDKIYKVGIKKTSTEN